MDDIVIVVDEDDVAAGSGSKMDVHSHGILHRAFSVIIYDDIGRILVQRRSRAKYHCGGMLSNSCCGHPRPGESVELAATRRVREELGAELSDTPLFIGSYRYTVPLDNEMTENEIVHVFVSRIGKTIEPNPAEVDGIIWMHYDDVMGCILENQDEFTYWFRMYLLDAGDISETLRKMFAGRR